MVHGAFALLVGSITLVSSITLASAVTAAADDEDRDAGDDEQDGDAGHGGLMGADTDSRDADGCAGEGEGCAEGHSRAVVLGEPSDQWREEHGVSIG
jgi:hypothetical protein